ncbi:wax ester synthase/diacylglycerol acyltransferase 11 [Manihot esculenta]|uniref:Uncharacterized protein n=1 Tax=Manihot esculenta TaxID=3983 RepID=A0ACB7G1G0_MANES|nr:wax ester synthase/diacylglycerol acyltransferase 11 [Manihot esculenta]KAG8633563.1 hypothetical protein MANES_18G115800v8 [Manihot esculenta]
MEGLRPIHVTKEDGEDEGQLLSPVSRIFHQPNCSVYIILFLGFKTPINPDGLKPALAHIFLRHPRFLSLLVVDDNGKDMRWVRTEVNLDNHLIIPTFDPSMESPDKYVEDYAANLSTTVINKSIPLWDVHILNLETSEAKSTVIIRVHHSLGDGTSLMALLLSCSRKVSNPEELPTIPTTKTRNPMFNSCRLWQFFLKLWLSMLVCWNTIVDVVMFMATVFFLDDTKTPLKSPEIGIVYTPSRRRFVHTTISLDDVKLVKNAMDATINDVMVGVTQAALSRYLNRKYGDEAKEGKNNLPKNIRLRAAVAVDIRPYSYSHTYQDVIKTNMWGNKIGFILFPFKIALRDDPLDHVREAMLVSKRKKASLEAKFTHFLAKLCSRFFDIRIPSMLSRTTIGFSNLPGPRDEISCLGYKVTFMAPSLYGQACVSILTSSYMK